MVRFGDKICDSCRERAVYIGKVYCMRCGKPLLSEYDEYCRDCRRTEHLFKRGRALYIYNDAVRASITKFKYGNRQEYAEFYGYEIAKRLGGFISECRADCIVPVPISEKKMKSRGYNQAELIADQISIYTGIRVSRSMILRDRDTPPMKDLSRSERMKNLKGAFKIGTIDVKCRNVIIVDDIYTTGSTIDAMASVLMTAGAENIYFVALASGTPI